MKRLNSALFLAISLTFSAVILIMTLFGAIRLAGLNSRAAETARRIDELETENGILSAKIENSLSLEEIENYAREKFGMSVPAPEQIFVIKEQGPLG